MTVPSFNTIIVAFVCEIILTQKEKWKKNLKLMVNSFLNQNGVLEQKMQKDGKKWWEYSRRSKIYIDPPLFINTVCSPCDVLMICCHLETELHLCNHYLAGQRLQFPSKSVHLLLLVLTSLVNEVEMFNIFLKNFSQINLDRS